MMEVLTDSKQRTLIASQIAGTMHSWLDAEIKSSMAGNNQVLDDYVAWHKSLAKPANDPSDQNFQKAAGHAMRIRQVSKDFAQVPENDNFAAKQLFCVQMYQSGMFRQQCFIEARDAPDYNHRRLLGGPAGINLQATVAERLAKRADRPQALDELLALTETDTLMHLGTIRLLKTFGQAEIGRSQTPSVTALRAMQSDWADLATDYIVFGAALRGGEFASVPFWEPKSISENPAVYYPLAEGVAA